MAEMALQVVVSPLLGVIFDKLTSLLLGEFGSLWGVQKDLEKLSRTASTVRLVLQDAEVKKNHNTANADWLRKLKEVAYEADDVIDECIAQALFSPDSDANGGSCSTQVCDSFSICFDFKHLKLRHKIASRIKAVREKFDEIAEEKRNFHLHESLEEIGAVKELSQDRETGSTVLESYVCGRDVDIEKIVNILLSNENNFLVFSIVGIGGLGKTTLTQCVFNNTSIEKSFQVKIWVCVSEEFSAKRLIKMIIESISGKKCELENLDALQNRLKELLSGKKFLLVLDDVWNEDSGKWDELKFPLNCGANGSSVITTTRLPNVSQIMGADLVYELAPLLDEECWSLFKVRAFGKEAIENNELEIIGKDIVSKCRGLPLATKALGGSLRFERDVNVWISIRSSEIWELHEDGNDGGILPSLRLSYNHLPSDLKPCFAYCSVFPKDHAIRITDLVQLWMANDLVQPRRGMELEDVGHQIFNQLVLRAFFQDLDQDRKGMKTCKMHDLMHDLAFSVAGKECLAFAFDGGGEVLANIPKNTRHLSITIRTKDFHSIRNLHPCLRTFLVLGCIHVAFRLDPSGPVLKNLNNLRALDLSETPIENLPVSIGKMKHLKYLNLSNTDLVCLPTSLCDLKSLQTMKLRGCRALKKLPARIHNLVNLIHLDLYGCDDLLQMPPRIGEWVGLRTLGCFIVEPRSGQRIKELQGLNQLGGDLEIRGLGHVRDAAEAEEANLAAKRNLSSLHLKWSRSQRNTNSEKVIEALQPPQDIHRVSITCYLGSRFPSWIQNLEKLVEIQLSCCSNCENLPPLGRLPLLKRLFLHSMDSLKRINPEFYGTASDQAFFPSLEHLSFLGMPNWEEWQALDHGQVFPCLKYLIFEECPNLAELPFQTLYSVQHLFLWDCNKLMVSSLPCLRSLKLSRTFNSLQNLKVLETLKLNYCSFSSLPQQIGNLTSLKSLKIESCDALTSLSQSLQYLSSLETIGISYCSNLKFTRGDFQHLLALQSLTFDELPKLTCLPDLDHLPNLQTLEITQCKNLQGLPQWLQNLTSLRTLKIRECHPDLHVQCNKDNGEYWPYISHIPVLNVASSSDS